MKWRKKIGKMSIHVFFSLSLINASSIVSYRLYSPPSYTSVISLLCGCFWLNFPAFHIAIHIEITICCRHFYRYVSVFFFLEWWCIFVCVSSSSFSCCFIKTKRCICSYLWILVSIKRKFHRHGKRMYICVSRLQGMSHAKVQAIALVTSLTHWIMINIESVKSCMAQHLPKRL